jgi:hypothetical protein
MSQTTGNVKSSHVSPSAVQSTHEAPFEPHSVDTVPAWQLFVLSQQPEQTSEHGHTLPPVSPNPVWQLPSPSQQPSGQVAALQTKPPHVPSKQKPLDGQLLH